MIQVPGGGVEVYVPLEQSHLALAPQKNKPDQKLRVLIHVTGKRAIKRVMSIWVLSTQILVQPGSNIFFTKKIFRMKTEKSQFHPMKFRWPSGKEPSLRDEFCISNHAGAFSNPISNMKKPLEKRKQSLDNNQKQQSTITCTDIT